MTNLIVRVVRVLKYSAAALLLTLLSSVTLAQTTTTVGQAQTIARLYSASLDRPPFTNGLNFFINSFVSGRTVISIAEDFVLSAEFVAKYGELDDVAYVERLFLNVLGRPGAQGGIDFWVNNLASGNSRAFVLAQFADSAENIARTAILYDSMAFTDGQWQYSLVDTVVQGSCGNPGCLQTELNGALAGASIALTPLRDTGTQLARINTLSEDNLRTVLGTGFFNDLSDLDRLQLLGLFPPIQIASGQLYLLTTDGGQDFDNDQNQLADANPTAVAGQLHAIVSAEQLAMGMQINVMTEAAYQSMVGTFDGLSDEQVSQGLDSAATKLVKNINGDGVVDYLDVLAWRRLFDNDNIRTDLIEVNKLAVAVGIGADGESLQIFSNRMLGGASAVGLDETRAVSISPDGTCDGRGRTIINRKQETIATLPPTTICGDGDTGRVDSAQGDITGVITPSADGLPSNTQIRGNRVDMTGIDPANNRVTVEITDSSGNSRRGTVPVTSTDAPAELSRRFRSLQDDSVGPGNIEDDNSGEPVAVFGSPLRRVWGMGKSKPEPGKVTTAETELFDETLTESMSYGALASNFTACVVFRFISQLEAQGDSVDPDLRSWALAGCTSALAEVNTWAAERTAGQITAFETAVPEVELDGCSDCFSTIASPADGASFEAGTPILFNGVAPASNTGVVWDFGDGESSTSRTPTHSYAVEGTYLAQFMVDYSNMTSGSSQVTVNVGPAVPAGSFNLEGYFAYTFSQDGCSASGRVRFFLAEGQGLFFTYFPESSALIDTNPCVVEIIATQNQDSPFFGPQTFGPDPDIVTTIYTEQEFGALFQTQATFVDNQMFILLDPDGFRQEYNRIAPIQ